MKNWAQLSGYAVIEVKGEAVEKFVNLALTRDILLWDIVRISQHISLLKVSARQFRRLRKVARATGCRIRVREKRGPAFIIPRLRKRYTLLVGMLFFLAITWTLSSFIWTVDIRTGEPLEHITEDQVLQEAKALGLKPGAWKGAVDISGIEEELLRRICELSWVDIKVRGSRVLVEVIERRIPPEQLPGVDLRAGKHAVVTEILVLSGEQRVQPGDEVLPGDVLISGRIIEPSGEERLVRARGIVRGRVAYQGSAEVVLYREEITPTGRLVRGLDVSVPGRGYTLVRPQVPFEHYQMDEQKKKFLVWKDPLWEVTFVTRTYREVIVEPKSYHPLEALREAQQQALEQARSQIVSGGKIVGEHVEVSQVEGKTICRARVEVIEDIGLKEF